MPTYMTGPRPYQNWWKWQRKVTETKYCPAACRKLWTEWNSGDVEGLFCVSSNRLLDRQWMFTIKTNFENYLCFLKEQMQCLYRVWTKETWWRYPIIEYRCVEARPTFSFVLTQKNVLSILWKRHILMLESRTRKRVFSNGSQEVHWIDHS